MIEYHNIFCKKGLLVFCLVMGLAACNGDNGDSRLVPPDLQGGNQDEVTLTMGGVKVSLEVAADEASRLRGLMYRKSLDPDHGMIFIYPEAKILSFYMKNTYVPLDIAFISDDGEIINIERMRPFVVEPPYQSRRMCRFAIEMNDGWFSKHGLNAGDTIKLTSEIQSIEAEY